MERPVAAAIPMCQPVAAAVDIRGHDLSSGSLGCALRCGFLLRTPVRSLAVEETHKKRTRHCLDLGDASVMTCPDVEQATRIL